MIACFEFVSNEQVLMLRMGSDELSPKYAMDLESRTFFLFKKLQTEKRVKDNTFTLAKFWNLG